MDYYGLLFLYYLKGLSGKSVLRLFFNVEVGGTEQLLPENTSTPTTTPILADIQYPDGLRTDQYFTYRETPTTVSNKARIKTIKGNTLVWNQQNYDNFTDASKWLVNDGSKYSISVGGNVLTVTCAGVPDNNGSVRISGVNSIVGHKYLLLSDVKSPKTVGFKYLYSPVASGSLDISVSANVLTQFGKVVQINSSSGFYIYFNANMALAQGDVVEIKNHQIIDLTQMFGTTKADEIYAMEQAQSGSGVAYFKSLFPLNHYSYNQGSLLSFNGNGIKTVGFNQWDEEWEVGGIDSSSGQPITGNDRFRSKNFISLFPNVVYYAKLEGLTSNDFRMYYYDANKNFIGVGTWQYSGTFTTPSNALFGKFVRVNKTTYTSGDICINISDSNRNGEYEPYTTQTTNLPISTYFPTGMKSAESVYDELTETKAITRVMRNTITGSDIASASVEGTNTFRIGLNKQAVEANNAYKIGLSNRYSFAPSYADVIANDKTMGFNSTGATMILHDSSLSTVDDLRIFFDSFTLEFVYPLATPTETSITTEDANEALSLLMGKSVSSSNAKQMIDIITKGE